MNIFVAYDNRNTFLYIVSIIWIIMKYVYGLNLLFLLYYVGIHFIPWLSPLS